MGREFLLWSLGLLVLRALAVVALGDVFFYGEELEKGAAAKAMLDGIGVPHHKLAYHYYEGGGFFISHLKALAFLLVGENLLAHKLCGLLTCWLVFAAFWRLLDFHFGRTAARIGALLLIFGPVSLQRISLLSLGIHFESMALGIFLLDGGMRILREAQPSTGQLFRLGLACGFALFFSYQSALVIGWVGLMILIRKPGVVFSKTGAAGTIGLVLGALPLIYMATQVGSALLDIHGTSLTDTGSNADRVVGLARSLLFEGPASERFVAWFYLSSGLLGVVLALTGPDRTRRWLAALLAGFAVLWLAAWYFGPFVPESINHWFAWLRFSPLVLVVLLLCAAGSAARFGTVSKVVVALAVVLGVWRGGATIVAGQPWSPRSNLALLLRTKGYDYRGYFKMLMGHLEAGDGYVDGAPRPTASQILPLLNYDEPHRDLLLTDLAERWFDDQRIHMDLQAQIGALEELGIGDQRPLMRGMGLSALVAAKARFNPPKALASLQFVDEPLRSQLAEAIGYSTGSPQTAGQLVALVRECSNGPSADAFLLGAGARFFRNLVVSPYGEGRVLNESAVHAMILEELPDQAERMLVGFEAEKNRWTLP